MFILQIAYTRPLRSAGKPGRTAAMLIEDATDADDGLAFLRAYDFDAVLVELRQPGDLDTIRAIRRAGFTVPILAMTAGHAPGAWGAALDTGADDAAMIGTEDETLARLRALVRRRAGFTESRLCIGPLEIRLDRRQCMVAGEPVRLTPTQFRLLAMLALRTGRVVRCSEMLAHIWGTDCTTLAKSVDVVISRLRQRLTDAGAPGVIQNRYGEGYFIAPAAPVECAG